MGHVAYEASQLEIRQLRTQDQDFYSHFCSEGTILYLYKHIHAYLSYNDTTQSKLFEQHGRTTELKIYKETHNAKNLMDEDYKTLADYGIRGCLKSAPTIVSTPPNSMHVHH